MKMKATEIRKMSAAELEAIMAKPLSELKELYNHRDIEK